MEEKTVSKLSLDRLETAKEIVEAWMKSAQYQNEHVKKGNDIFIIISPQLHLVAKCLDEFREVIYLIPLSAASAWILLLLILSPSNMPSLPNTSALHHIKSPFQWIEQQGLFTDRVEMEKAEAEAFRPKLTRKKNYFLKVATSLEMCQQVLRNDQKQNVISSPDYFVEENVGEKRKRGTSQ